MIALIVTLLLLAGCAPRDYVTEHGSCREFTILESHDATLTFCADWS